MYILTGFLFLLYLRFSLSADSVRSWYKCTTQHCASYDPPGGISLIHTPQFILLTHDDTVHPQSTGNIDSLVGRLQMTNGCRIPCTFFVMTNGTDPDEVSRRWAMGDEIGAHAMEHIDQNLLDPGRSAEDLEKMRSEIVGCRDWIMKNAKLPAGQVVGYRTPLLAESTAQRQVLEDAGFLYDASIVESVKTDEAKLKRVWPYRMDAGIPQNRHKIKKGMEREEKHVGLWEVPVWVLLHNGQRYSMDPGRGGLGNGVEGDPFEILKSNLDAAYDGNRAPVPFYTHIDWYTEYRQARGRLFVEYALSKPGVYFVTMQTLLAWMQAPVPIDEMDEWLEQRCRGPDARAVGAAAGKGKGGSTGDLKMQYKIEKSTRTGRGEGALQRSGLTGEGLAIVGVSVLAVSMVLANRRKARRSGVRPPR